MDTETKDKNILLIGGTGFVGIHLVKKLTEMGRDVTVLCKAVDKEVKILDFVEKITLSEGDIADYKVIERIIKGKDVIVNLASVVQPSRSFNPYTDLDINCKGQLNILEARKNVNPNSKYIFFGSRAQFGKTNEKNLPLNEEFRQKPVSLYGIHKQSAENYCKLYKTAFNIDSIILRLSIVYGPEIFNENKYSVINKFIKRALKNEKFEVNGYGKDLKDFIYIGDLVYLIIKIIDSDIKDGIFNIGSGEKVKLIEIAEKIIKFCGSGSFESVPFSKKDKAFELGSFYYDISKAKNTFNWEPKTKIDDGIKRTIGHFKGKK
jgi:UDP-glucose 4-epimerase